jgi:hypothetical protein
VSTLLHSNVYMLLHNFLNVQIANKMRLQKNPHNSTVVALYAYYSGHVVSGTDCFSPLRHWVRWFESKWRHECVCVCVCVCVCMCVCARERAVMAFRRADPHALAFLPTVCKINYFIINSEWEQARGPTAWK